VLARRRLWLGLAAGVMLTLDLTWATYNRAMLTESPFTSFHVLSLAVILWHYDRRQRLRAWELIAAGLLFGWTLLFRGTGLPLIAALLLVYAVMTRALRPALLVALGIGLFLAGVLVHSQWRYGEAGLVGPQHDTLVSALYSYHLFSPGNGGESAALHAGLRECMGYLDYDDVPGYENFFIYNHFNYCLVGYDENFQFIPGPRIEVTQRVSKAFRELILSRPFDYARVLLVELGKGLTFDETEAIQINTSDTLEFICSRWYDEAFCSETASYQRDVQTADSLRALTAALDVPSRLHHAAKWISSPTDAVHLAAFVMLCGFVLIAGRQQLLVVLAVGFIGYQMLVSAAVHVLLARYIDVLSPFFIVLSVMAVGTLSEQARGFRPRLWMLLAALTVITYALFANASLRHHAGAPLSARLGVNLLQKYGFDDADFALYQALQPVGGRALFPGGGERETLFGYGLVLQSYDLYGADRTRLEGWRYTRLPGYIRQLGLDYLMLDEDEWAALPPADRDILNDPQHYRLVTEWRDGERLRLLYAVVGDARGVFPVAVGDNVNVFEQSDGALHVYRLDADRNGIFVARIEPGSSGLETQAGEGGWSLTFTPRDDGRTRVTVLDAVGEVFGSVTLWLVR
jgi:hypothetical protein